MKMFHAVDIFARQTRIFTLYRTLRQNKLYRRWLQAGKNFPPPHLAKQQIIREYAQRFNIPVFIETGTYLGDMVNAVKDIFDEIYSIELGMELSQQAKKRFANAKHITILQGDSGEVLKDVLAYVEKPCLFWLDSHYSAGITSKGNLTTPIQKELVHILNHPMVHSHRILIDDARSFTGEGDYPSIRFLQDLVTSAGFDNFQVKDDIIRIYKQV